MGLRKELKNDVWKIIEGVKVPKERENKFRILVLQLLLESQGFNLGKAFDIADKLEKKYNKIVDDFNEYLKDSNGDLLDVLKHIDKDFDNKIKPLLEKIKTIGK
jgi:hypothetical protein